MNRKSGTTNAYRSYCEGYNCTASGEYSHAEGFETVAGGSYSHAEGYQTQAYGSCSHTAGYGTRASYDYSAAFGYGTAADREYAVAMGVYNKYRSDAIFTIGYGTDSSNTANVFRVCYDGSVCANKAYSSSGADYAEYISEWYDGNKDNEDRVGYFVTIKDNKLYKANEGDYIVGITSGNPSVVGNGDEDYFYRYKRDNMNRILYEDVEVKRSTGIGDDGVEIFETIIEKHPIHRDDYDPSLTYISRSERPEWDYVGMIGTLPVYDDGTCEVNGYCKCGDDGIGTKADTKETFTYRVLERVTDNIVRVILK
jgi:hypothetical protein